MGKQRLAGSGRPAQHRNALLIAHRLQQPAEDLLVAGSRVVTLGIGRRPEWAVLEGEMRLEHARRLLVPDSTAQRKLSLSAIGRRILSRDGKRERLCPNYPNVAASFQLAVFCGKLKTC